jgi:serine/threonine protein kinase
MVLLLWFCCYGLVVMVLLLWSCCYGLVVLRSQGRTHPRLSAEAKDLISRMLKVKPAERITMPEILAHPWLTGQASDEALGAEHTARVKTLHIRRKLQSVFSVRKVTACPSTLPDPVQSQGISRWFMPRPRANSSGDMVIDNVCNWSESDIEAEARYYFSVFDRDGDGIIDKEDLHVGVAGVINSISKSEHNELGLSTSAHGEGKLRLGPGVLVDIDDMFDVIDTDHSRSVNFEAFRLFYIDVLMPSIR